MYRSDFLRKIESYLPAGWGKRIVYISSGRIIGLGLLLAVLLLVVLDLAFIKPLGAGISDYISQKEVWVKERNQLAAADNKRIARLSSQRELPQVLDFIRQCFENRGIVAQEIAVSPLSLVTDGEYRQSLIKVNAVGQSSIIIKALEEIQSDKRYFILFQDMNLTSVDQANTRAHISFVITCI